jgi:hypothetical protein
LPAERFGLNLASLVNELRDLASDEAKERVDSRESLVARCHAIAALLFEVGEKGARNRGRDLLDSNARG